MLKSTGSEFYGFLEDEYTTLAETDDRILATAVTARWRYVGHRRRLGREPTPRSVRTLLLEAFADTHSLALQQTLYAMGEACSSAPGGRRGPAVPAEQAPLPGRPGAVRPGEPQRGLLRRRPPLRAHRRHRGPRRRRSGPGLVPPAGILKPRDEPRASNGTERGRRATGDPGHHDTPAPCGGEATRNTSEKQQSAAGRRMRSPVFPRSRSPHALLPDATQEQPGGI